MEFKDRIRLLREEDGLNLTQLAVKFDLKEAGVRSWENGRTKPGADTLIKLAEYFTCTTDYLLGVSDFKSREEKQKLDDQISQLAVYVDGFPFRDKERLYFIFQALANTCGRLKNLDEVKAEYLRCLEIISSNVSQTTMDAYGPIPLGKETRDALTLLALNKERNCKNAIDGLYRILEEQISTMHYESDGDFNPEPKEESQ